MPDLALLQREIQRLFERLAEFDRAAHASKGQWTPPVDVFESRGRLLVLVEMAGVDPASVRVAKDDRGLVVSGERRGPKPPAGQSAWVCLERPRGRLVRRIPLENLALDVGAAEARLARGILTVSIPCVPERRGREVEIPVKRGDEA